MPIDATIVYGSNSCIKMMIRQDPFYSALSPTVLSLDRSCQAEHVKRANTYARLIQARS